MKFYDFVHPYICSIYTTDISNLSSPHITRQANYTSRMLQGVQMNPESGIMIFGYVSLHMDACWLVQFWWFVMLPSRFIS